VLALPKRILDPFALRDVGHKIQRRGLALPVDQNRIQLHPQQASVFTKHPKSVTPGNIFALKTSGVTVSDHIAVIRMDKIDKWPGSDLLAGITGDLGRHGIEKRHPAVLGDKNRLAGIFKEGAVFLLAFPKRTFRLLAVGNIVIDRHDLSGRQFINMIFAPARNPVVLIK